MKLCNLIILKVVISGLIINLKTAPQKHLTNAFLVQFFSFSFYMKLAKLINLSMLILNIKIAFLNLSPNINLRAAKFLQGKTKARVILFIFLFIRQRLEDSLENIITLRFQVLRTFGKYSTQSNSMRRFYPQSKITSCYGKVYITQKQSSLCFYQYFAQSFLRQLQYPIIISLVCFQKQMEST